MNKLKPCPFCGGKAELLIVPGNITKWIVRCTKCYTNNGTFVSDHDAIEAWNRRAKENKLKPCPFCGGSPLSVVDDETEEKFGVKCFKCGGCIYPEKDTLDEAIEAWNRRAKDER